MKPMLQYNRSHGARPNLAATLGDLGRTELQIVYCVLRYKETVRSFRYTVLLYISLIQVSQKFELEKKTNVSLLKNPFHSPPKEIFFET